MSVEQLSLEDVFGHVTPSEETIRDAFLRFHQDNPHVYDELVLLARRARRMGHKKVGIGMLFEVLRWNYLVGVEDMKPEDLAWATGVFEGEGTFYSGHRGRYTARRMTFSSIDEDVVMRFHEIVGCGRVSGPYTPSQPNRKPFWRWTTDTWDEIEPLLKAMWPMLSERRRQAAQAILDHPPTFGFGKRRGVHRKIETHRPVGEFLLNNNYRSYYARLIMACEADLDGVFETRRLHGPDLKAAA